MSKPQKIKPVEKPLTIIYHTNGTLESNRGELTPGELASFFHYLKNGAIKDILTQILSQMSNEEISEFHVSNAVFIDSANRNLDWLQPAISPVVFSSVNESSKDLKLDKD